MKKQITYALLVFAWVHNAVAMTLTTTSMTTAGECIEDQFKVTRYTLSPDIRNALKLDYTNAKIIPFGGKVMIEANDYPLIFQICKKCHTQKGGSTEVCDEVACTSPVIARFEVENDFFTGYLDITYVSKFCPENMLDAARRATGLGIIEAAPQP